MNTGESPGISAFVSGNLSEQSGCAVVRLVGAVSRRLPEQPTDPRSDITVHLSGEMLIAPRHGRVGPAHDSHYRPLGHLQDEQDRGVCVSSVVEPSVSQPSAIE